MCESKNVCYKSILMMSKQIEGYLTIICVLFSIIEGGNKHE
jgi:hypothetical protein